MLNFRRKPEPPAPDYSSALRVIVAEQEHTCGALAEMRTDLVAQHERWLSDLDRVHARLARIEAILLKIDLWAAERIDGWPQVGKD